MSTQKPPSPPAPLPHAGEGSKPPFPAAEKPLVSPLPRSGRGAGGEGAAGHIQVTVQTDTHIHQSKPCQAGQVIAVTRTEAQFLLRAGVIQKIPASLNKEKQHG